MLIIYEKTTRTSCKTFSMLLSHSGVGKSSKWGTTTLAASEVSHSVNTRSKGPSSPGILSGPASPLGKITHEYTHFCWYKMLYHPSIPSETQTREAPKPRCDATAVVAIDAFSGKFWSHCTNDINSCVYSTYPQTCFHTSVGTWKQNNIFRIKTVPQPKK